MNWPDQIGVEGCSPGSRTVVGVVIFIFPVQYEIGTYRAISQKRQQMKWREWNKLEKSQALNHPCKWLVNSNPILHSFDLRIRCPAVARADLMFAWRRDLWSLASKVGKDKQIERRKKVWKSNIFALCPAAARANLTFTRRRNLRFSRQSCKRQADTE